MGVEREGAPMARLMMWHVDYFRATPQEKGRSDVVQRGEVIDAKESILVFVSFEKQDEGREEEVIEKSYGQINGLSSQLGVKAVVLNPFAHLFGELAKPDEASRMLAALGDRLEKGGFAVHRMAFGIFYTIELKAKGHRLSRVSRMV
jgi:threonyl-tRNA synthetase